jgi:hypothetical protein
VAVIAPNGWQGSSLPSVRTSAPGRHVGQRVGGPVRGRSCYVCQWCARGKQCLVENCSRQQRIVRRHGAGKARFAAGAEFAVPMRRAGLGGTRQKVPHEWTQVAH